jgi:hypothetical protein
MKVQEIVQLTKPHLPGTTGSVVTDQIIRTAVPVEIPTRIVGRREPPESRNISAVADPNDGVTGELPPALDVSRINAAKTPHTRELEFIIRQIARLPTQPEP